VGMQFKGILSILNMDINIHSSGSDPGWSLVNTVMKLGV
jgi:hypothetical protein